MSAPVRSRYYEDILAVTNHISMPDWEDTSTKIIEVLARDITFPQPFSVKEVVICGTSFFQPAPHDRFFLDKTAFFLNHITKDDMYEGVQAPYSVVRQIKVSMTTGLVVVTLSSPAVVGDKQMDNIPKDRPMLMTFNLLASDIDRFTRAVKARNLERALSWDGPSLSNTTERISINSPIKLDIEGRNPFHSASYEEKVKIVEQERSDDNIGYISGFHNRKENISDAEIPVSDTAYKSDLSRQISVPDIGFSTPAGIGGLPSQGKAWTIVPALPITGQTDQHAKTISDTASIIHQHPSDDKDEVPSLRSSSDYNTLRRSRSQDMRDKIFGTSDEELTDISDSELVHRSTKAPGNVKPVSKAKGSQSWIDLVQLLTSTDQGSKSNRKVVAPSRSQSGVLDDGKEAADQKQVDKKPTSAPLGQLIRQSTKAKQAVPNGASKRSTPPPIGDCVDDISAKIFMDTRGRKPRASAAAALKRIARDAQSPEMDDHFAEPDETSGVFDNIYNTLNTKPTMGTADNASDTQTFSSPGHRDEIPVPVETEGTARATDVKRKRRTVPDNGPARPQRPSKRRKASMASDIELEFNKPQAQSALRSTARKYGHQKQKYRRLPPAPILSVDYDEVPPISTAKPALPSSSHESSPPAPIAVIVPRSRVAAMKPKDTEHMAPARTSENRADLNMAALQGIETHPLVSKSGPRVANSAGGPSKISRVVAEQSSKPPREPQPVMTEVEQGDKDVNSSELREMACEVINQGRGTAVVKDVIPHLNIAKPVGTQALEPEPQPRSNIKHSFRNSAKEAYRKIHRNSQGSDHAISPFEASKLGMPDPQSSSKEKKSQAFRFVLERTDEGSDELEKIEERRLRLGPSSKEKKKQEAVTIDLTQDDEDLKLQPHWSSARSPSAFSNLSLVNREQNDLLAPPPDVEDDKIKYNDFEVSLDSSLRMQSPLREVSPDNSSVPSPIPRKTTSVAGPKKNVAFSFAIEDDDDDDSEGSFGDYIPREKLSNWPSKEAPIEDRTRVIPRQRKQIYFGTREPLKKLQHQSRPEREQQTQHVGSKFAKPTSVARNSTGEHSIPAKLLPQDFDSEISAIIDEITCVIQARISNLYDGVRDSVRNARQQLLSQAANDLRSLNELNVTTFNNLIDLEAAYVDYSKRFLTALGEAGRLGEEGLQLSKNLLREHDRGVQIHTSKLLTLRELPESVTKWL
ncbi:hypothetical protein HETIRDRAFT_100638 [Heterobasidion irregulare TC 32-1]|uniref:Uncharacterized protein n=1 Tax=Heterobasidion irregulare (strain TC 32-1) TaxID=747525 RepID=W4KL12_HETIT|nr:uncharacterized protein HETIRDRAFT_100638 [Heterobasidion irregulare TC 32-1]ETW85751.1 hypothetical protein HETIRDRAFT_100638 [Heterobasidion irregulare TC 32-1]